MMKRAAGEVILWQPALFYPLRYIRQGQRTFLKSFVGESNGKSVSLFALIKSELINTPDYGICIIRKKVAAIRHDELCRYSS